MVGEFLKESYLALTSISTFHSGLLVNSSTVVIPAPCSMSLPGCLTCSSNSTYPKLNIMFFFPSQPTPVSTHTKSSLLFLLFKMDKILIFQKCVETKTFGKVFYTFSFPSPQLLLGCKCFILGLLLNPPPCVCFPSVFIFQNSI